MEPPLLLTYREFFRDPEFRLQIEYSSFPEHSVPTHTHEFAELVIVRHGRGVHAIGSQRYTIAAGDVFFVRPKDVHEYRDIEGLDLCNILFDPIVFLEDNPALSRVPGFHALFHIEPILRQQSGFAGKLHLLKDDMRFVYDIIESVEEEMEGQRPAFELMAHSYFNLLLGFLSRKYTEQESQASHRTMNLSRALAHIERYYSEPIALPELARIANMSISTLGRSFRDLYNTTPMDYLIRHRLRKATELLREPTRTITEVALDTGFSDSNYFCRRFRLTYGCSPSEYRKRLL